MSCCICSHSCVHCRQRAKVLIGLTKNSRFRSRIQMRGYGSALDLSFVASLMSFIKVGEILGNVDTDMHVRFKCKQSS